MITARIANDQTKKVLRKQIEVDETIVNSAIQKAIKEGKYSVTLDGHIRPGTKEWLKGLGYKLQTGSQYNKSYTCIKWD